MARRKGAWSSTSYESTAEEIRSSGGPTTGLGEQRAREGRGLDPLVDPRTHDCMREAVNLLVPQPNGTFKLESGIALPWKTEADTTGSMGGNVEIIFQVLPRVQNLLVQGPRAVLRRYHVQMATAVVQDKGDMFPYEHSEFEPDNEVERQMRLLVPEKDGGDSTEDYQLGLWYTAERIRTTIGNYGLKGYYFIVGDEIGRDRLTRQLASQVFGLDLQSEMSVRELGKQVLKNWHAFYLRVGDNSYTTRYWGDVFGKERVVTLPQTDNLAEVQALIAALTEGVLDLQSAPAYLREVGVDQMTANRIVRAVSDIPLRAQAILPNFDKVPLAGAVFASREDVWPLNPAPSDRPHAPSGEGEINWQL